MGVVGSRCTSYYVGIGVVGSRCTSYYVGIGVVGSRCTSYFGRCVLDNIIAATKSNV